MTLAEALEWKNVHKVFLVEAAVRYTERGSSSSVNFYWTNTLQPQSGVQASRWVRRAKRFNSQDYLPIVAEIPRVGLMVEERFGDLGKRAGGRLRCFNLERYFDDLRGYDWDAGTVTLRMGADVPQADTWDEMAYVDFETMGVWRIGSWRVSSEFADFELIDLRRRLDGVTVPQEYWRLTDHNGMDPNKDGAPKTIDYGQIVGAKAVCVDLKTREFRVSSHEIHSFGAIRTGTPLVEVVPVTTDLNNAAFTLASGDWDGEGEEVYVDFIGKPRANGDPMVNPADVAEDLLNTYGMESVTFASASSSSRERWVLGYDRQGRERQKFEFSLRIDEERSVLDIIAEDIVPVAGALFYPDLSGEFIFKTWQPQASEGITELRQGDIISISKETDALATHTRAVGKYAHNLRSGVWQSVDNENDSAKTQRQLLAHSSTVKELAVYLRRCAQLWASRTVGMDLNPLQLWSVEASHRAVLLEPGDPVRVQDERFGDQVLEVIGLNHDLMRGSSRLLLGNWRGLGDGPGFFDDDSSPAFPARLGGGSCAVWSTGWTDEQAQWARENMAYWLDADGYAKTGDNRSWKASVWA